jgi:RimJ/RimL family protein N-acetyltransferase
LADASQPILNIVGDKIALGPLSREQLCVLDLVWGNDFVIKTHGHPPGPVTAEMVAAKYERIMKAEAELWFLLYERSTLRPIGTTHFSEMRCVYQTAEFNIPIEAKDCWGKGDGTESTRLMLHYAFATLGFNMIWLRVLSSNERAIRAYRRAGFREAGRLREAQRVGQHVTIWCIWIAWPGSSWLPSRPQCEAHYMR